MLIRRQEQSTSVVDNSSNANGTSESNNNSTDRNINDVEFIEYNSPDFEEIT